MRFAKEGWPFVAPFTVAAAALLAAGRPRAAAAAAAAGAGILLFFRDPARHWEGDPAVVLAPADGVVTRVDSLEDPAVGPGLFARVATFLSVFDVHLQRVPVHGTVVASSYRPGRKVAAFRRDADALNASHLTVLETAAGDRVAIRQIAGLVARRVVCDLEEGQPVRRGQRLGLIKFGSRVDLLVPASYRVTVRQGQRMTGGITPAAHPPERP